MAKKTITKKLTKYNWFQIFAPAMMFGLIGLSSVLWGGYVQQRRSAYLVFHWLFMVIY